jgi:probable F420-dependent oxidoreductase
MTAAQLTALVRKVDQLGYSTFWFPEAFGRDPFTLAAHILTVTDKLIVGTGIANVWKREPIAMIGAARTLAEMFPDRFILGLGVSHGPVLSQMGIKYEKPIRFMRDYLQKMKAAPYSAPKPASDPPMVIAALMPKMLELAGAETNGTIPVYVTPEQTARMRETLGPDKWICIQQIAILETDRATALRTARGVLAFYLTLPNYLRSFRSMGFDDADFANGGSDRLIDALVVNGGEKAIRDRIDAHYRAGATHVCMTLVPTQANTRERALPIDERALEALAPRSA